MKLLCHALCNIFLIIHSPIKAPAAPIFFVRQASLYIPA